MTVYSKHFNTRKTPQTQPIPGKNMVVNNAGGYGFEISAGSQFKRFLVLGTEGGTYYVGEKSLTEANATNAIKYIQGNGLAAVAEIVKVSVEALAPKNDAAIFALALAATYGDADTKKAAYAAIRQVCRTGTHLFTFLANVQNLRGWSRGLRNGVAKFYTERSLNSLDLQLIKYRQRDGWTHRDALRLAHANGDSAQNARFAYAVGKDASVIASSDLLNAFEAIQATTDPKEAASIITAANLPWEAIPTELLGSKEIWSALLPGMGYTALLRQLGKLTSVGVVTSNFDASANSIVAKLTDVEAIKKSKVHPFAIYLALKNYSNGHGFRGSLIWTPVPKIIDALNDAFELAFANVTPTGKNILIGVDVSGSMSAEINNTNISASEAAAVMAYITARVEPNNQVVLFDTTHRSATITKRDNLKSIVQQITSIRGGGTDCAQPIIFANKANLDIDAIVIYTDSETWAGNTHAVQELQKIRSRLGKNVKIINAATTATSNSISDPSDVHALGIAGFDASAPALISAFINGDM